MKTSCFNSVFTSPESDGQLKAVLSSRTIVAINKKQKLEWMSVRMGLLKLKSTTETLIRLIVRCSIIGWAIKDLRWYVIKAKTNWYVTHELFRKPAWFLNLRTSVRHDLSPEINVTHWFFSVLVHENFKLSRKSLCIRREIWSFPFYMSKVWIFLRFVSETGSATPPPPHHFATHHDPPEPPSSLPSYRSSASLKWPRQASGVNY